jgi:hypothetical protein
MTYITLFDINDDLAAIDESDAVVPQEEILNETHKDHAIEVPNSPTEPTVSTEVEKPESVQIVPS